jgi:hypothetical protein
MSYTLSAVLPFVLVVALFALAGSIASVTVISQTVTRHHRARVARHQSIPTYYRRLVAAH